MRRGLIVLIGLAVVTVGVVVVSMTSKTIPIAPAKATALCKDGTYSYSQNRSQACSSHRGVSIWL